MRSSQYLQNNTNWLTNNQRIERGVMIAVSNELHRKLTDAEMRISERIVRQLHPNSFRSEAELIDTAKRQVVHHISQILLRSQPDVHDVLRNIMNSEDRPDNANPLETIVSSYRPQIEISKIFNLKDAADLVSLIAPQNATKTAYIMLDTRYRSLDTDGITAFRWNMSNSIIATPGTVNNVNVVRNLKVIRSYPLRIPYTVSADSYYKRISMYIDEFNSQSAILHERGYMQFLFRPVLDGNFIELDNAYFNDGRFELNQLITRIDTITIRFGNPVQPVQFSADRSNVSILTYGTQTILRTAINHGMSTGDLVIFSDFTTQNANGDYVLINAINNENGITIDVTVGNVPDTATDFMIAIDTSVLFGAGAGTIAVVINSPAVTGTGTAFLSFFRANDIIVINGASYTVEMIASDTSLTLKTAYGGITASGLAYSRDNRVAGMQFICYFAAKRFYIPLELQYIDSQVV